MTQGMVKMKKASTKEIIKDYLKLKENKGREIPVSEISEKYNLKRTAISNAIKELQLKGIIEIERRPLRRGQYTIIWLTGTAITRTASHPDEVKKTSKKKKRTKSKYSLKNTSEMVNYLLSPNYEHTELLKRINQEKLNKFQLATGYVQPLLHYVGTQWENGELTTGEEHLISSRVEKIIYEFIPKINGENKGTILFCSVEGDSHNINLLLIEMLLADKYNIINLRRSLPIESLVQFINERPLREKIDWVFISATLTLFTGTLNRQINSISDSFPDIQIAIGGQAASDPSIDLKKVKNVVTNNDELEAFINYLRGE